MKEEQRMQRQFDVIIERDDEGNYVASVPQLVGCHTQARSLDAVMEESVKPLSCLWKCKAPGIVLR